MVLETTARWMAYCAEAELKRCGADVGVMAVLASASMR